MFCVHRMDTQNESAVIGNKEIKDHEYSDQDLVETKSIEFENNSELVELQLIIPIEVM